MFIKGLYRLIRYRPLSYEPSYYLQETISKDPRPGLFNSEFIFTGNLVFDIETPLSIIGICRGWC